MKRMRKPVPGLPAPVNRTIRIQTSSHSHRMRFHSRKSRSESSSDPKSDQPVGILGVEYRAMRNHKARWFVQAGKKRGCSWE